ncbi:distal membrane-arm assembly complex protein 2-like [Physella acuta]|uniref:distal membrane-arm assembly complex protein 2-like n=1 Tax=Physella acuta TaxID=109671 RepID=UPI0027DAD314|nr:distal membrane-arm assembly complex protein 2-like [Physella acuta]
MTSACHQFMKFNTRLCRSCVRHYGIFSKNTGSEKKNEEQEQSVPWGSPEVNEKFVEEFTKKQNLPNPVRNTEKEYFDSLKNPDRLEKGLLDGKFFTKKFGISKDLLAWLSWDINLNNFDEIRLHSMIWYLKTLRKEQKLQANRVEALGYDLSAAHFVVSQGGAVKFLGREAWYVRNKQGKSTLPNISVKGLYIEAIDFHNVAITQEAFENLDKLSQIRYMKFDNCQFFDDWCLARLYCLSETLEFLDIRNCSEVTDRGLSCLHSLKNLQCLKLSNLKKVQHIGLITLLLEEALPNLTVLGVSEEDLKPPESKYRGERKLVQALLGYFEDSEKNKDGISQVQV